MMSLALRGSALLPPIPGDFHAIRECCPHVSCTQVLQTDLTACFSTDLLEGEGWNSQRKGALCRYFTDRLMRACAELPKMCEFFHIPFQSGDDDILRDMRCSVATARGMPWWPHTRVIVPEWDVFTIQNNPQQ